MIVLVWMSGQCLGPAEPELQVPEAPSIPAPVLQHRDGAAFGQTVTFLQFCFSGVCEQTPMLLVVRKLCADKFERVLALQCMELRCLTLMYDHAHLFGAATSSYSAMMLSELRYIHMTRNVPPDCTRSSRFSRVTVTPGPVECLVTYIF